MADSKDTQPVKEGTGAAAITPSKWKLEYPDFNEGRKKGEPAIVKYSFKAKEPFGGEGYSVGYEDALPLSKEQRESALAHMLQISRVADIKFVEVPPEEAQMRFFRTRYVNEDRWKDSETKGFPGGHMYNSGSAPFPKVDIHISSRHFPIDSAATDFAPGAEGSGTMLHEIMHGIGAQHPKGLGKTPGYADVSIMSYLNKSNTLRLGDVEWLTQTFGESKRPDAIKFGNLPDDKNDSVVVGKDTTINLTSNQASFGHTIDLSQRGYSKRDIQIAPDATVKNVIAHEDAPLYFKGDGGSTTVQGSKKEDIFVPRGGNDTFTGNGNRDIVNLNADSGHGHRVTDFTVNGTTIQGNDKVNLGPDVKRLTMHFTKTEKGVPVIELEAYAEGAKKPGSTIRLEGAEIKEYYDIERFITGAEQAKIEAKTPADKERVETLTAEYLNKYHGVTANVAHDMKGNPVVELKMADHHKGDFKNLAKSFNESLKLPDGTANGQPAGVSATLLKDPKTGAEKEAITTTSTQLRNGYDYLERTGHSLISQGLTAEMRGYKAIRTMQENEAAAEKKADAFKAETAAVEELRKTDPDKLKDADALAANLNEAAKGTGFNKWKVVLHGKSPSVRMDTEGMSKEQLEKVAGALQDVLVKESDRRVPDSFRSFDVSERNLPGTHENIPGLMAQPYLIHQNKKERGITDEHYAKAFKEVSGELLITPEFTKEPEPLKLKPNTTPAPEKTSGRDATPAH